MHEVEEPEHVTALGMNVYDCVGVKVMNSLLGAIRETEGMNPNV